LAATYPGVWGSRVGGVGCAGGAWEVAGAAVRARTRAMLNRRTNGDFIFIAASFLPAFWELVAF
jgi:hypothetical protein